MSVRAITVRCMGILTSIQSVVVIMAGLTTVTSASIARFLRSHREDRRQKQISALLEQAETPGLSETVIEGMLARARRMISWDFARDKYPERSGVVSMLLPVVGVAAVHLVITWPGLPAGAVPPVISWVVWIAMVWSICNALRRFIVFDADAARQKLCQLGSGADIDRMEPPYGVRDYLLDGLKVRRFRNPELRVPTVNLILRDAWCLQNRVPTGDRRLSEVVVGGFLPELDSSAEWERLGEGIDVAYINAAIRRRNGGFRT